MAQVLLLFLPKSEGGYDCPPDFRRPWLESGELKKIGTKTVIGFLLVSRHIFKKVIRRHFLIGIFDRELKGPICLEHSMFVYLFVFIPLIFFYVLKTCFEWVNFSMKKRFFILADCVCVRLFFIFSFFKDFFPNLQDEFDDQFHKLSCQLGWHPC